MIQVVREALECVGRNVAVLVDSLRHLPMLPRHLNRVAEHAFEMSIRTVPIVAILSFFIGAVLALQTGFTLGRIGAENFVGSLVGLSITRELGPVMTAFLLSGRVGSATTAEIASMKVYEEVDALITMNISPTGYLVLPRVVAVFFVMPFLALVAIVVGWFGGEVISRSMDFINLPSQIYWRGLKEYTEVGDLKDGLIKAQVFGVAVILISCTEGLSTSGGPREIGRSVTKAVVFSMIFILFADYFVTRALL